jgi:hypothetical protein
MGFLHMKFRAGLVAFGAVIFVAGCAIGARREDDALVKAGFTKTQVPPGVSIAKSTPFLHFVHRTVNGDPMVFYSDPIACKCVYSGTEAQFAAYKEAETENAAICDQIDIRHGDEP